MNKTKLCLLIASTLFACSCSDDSSTDGCPDNSLRSESGKCGCEWPHPEKDDAKYWSESEQRCIESNHPQQNVCANGVAEIDNDSDGIIDCLEDQGCDRNPERSHAGECGCEWPHPEAFDDHDYDHIHMALNIIVLLFKVIIGNNIRIFSHTKWCLQLFLNYATVVINFLA